MFYTIGLSHHTPEEFARLLEKYHITLCIDLRSHVYPSLKWMPKTVRCETLGGQRGHQCLNNDLEVDIYRDSQRQSQYQEEWLFLLSQSAEERIALICSEGMPWKCHRRFLAVQLVAQDREVYHILPNGCYQSV